MHTHILTTLETDDQLDNLKNQSLIHMKILAHDTFGGYELKQQFSSDIGTARFWIIPGSNQPVRVEAISNPTSIWHAPVESFVETNFLTISFIDTDSELLALKLSSK